MLGDGVWARGLGPDSKKKIRDWNSQCLYLITGNDYNVEAKESTKSFNLLGALRARRCKWLGHVLRMDPDRLVHRAICLLHESDLVGTLMMDAPEHDSLDQLIELAFDRKAWRLHIREHASMQTSEIARRHPTGPTNTHKDFVWKESRELVTDLLKRNAYAEATALKLAEMPVGSLLAYTDGGCDGNGANGVRGASGWGACLTRSVVRKGWEDPPNRVLDELWGPIDTDPTSEWYMGASGVLPHRVPLRPAPPRPPPPRPLQQSLLAPFRASHPPPARQQTLATPNVGPL